MHMMDPDRIIKIWLLYFIYLNHLKPQSSLGHVWRTITIEILKNYNPNCEVQSPIQVVPCNQKKKREGVREVLKQKGKEES